ncbi:MAG: bifunctional UDP-N-acetylglucosamine diphosphorylase/glucosamine-1-phosphate N-acetyltransferase GlmU [Candidatus Babeliales bacterium]
MQNLQAIILAAGKATRFNSNRNKLFEKICGQEMILYVTQLLENLRIPTTMVIGHQKGIMNKIITNYHQNRITFSIQKKQLGTGHALLCSQNNWHAEHILIMNGDIPLVTKDILEKLYKNHLKSNATISFITAHSTNKSYGRVIKNAQTIKIVEALDFDGDIDEQCCINAGIYIMKKSFLTHYIDMLQQNTISNEFYITDLIEIANKKNFIITTTTAPFDQIRGVNNFEELWAAEQIKRAELIKHWMKKGVRFSFAQNTHIDVGASIGAGSYINNGVQLLNKTKIGKNCIIQPFSILDNAILENDVTIHAHSIIKDARVDAKVQVGPFAHIRKNTHIKSEGIVGSFVETKNSIIGHQSKAKHLTYLGNATIGSHVNIGAGTITCNYDGKKKEKTIIEDNVFVGSNNSLVAPVKLNKNSYTAAGSVITENVPANALAIARMRQINKPDYIKETTVVPSKKNKKKTKQPANNFSFIAARILTQEELNEES